MRFLRPLAATGVLCLLVLALWLGRWRHFQYEGLPLRENRFTGSVDAFVGEWRRIPRSETHPDPIADYLRKYGAGAVLDTAASNHSDNSFRAAH